MDSSSSLMELSITSQAPPSPWNGTFPPLENLAMDSDFVWLLCALFMSISWVVYVTYYNSRVIGFIITKMLNRFVKKGYVKIGSFSISVLSGKIMFRDVAFMNEDFTVRAQDGWMIFRWWRPYVKKEITEDLSHSDTRLSILLNGFELHIYNRSHLYAHLEQQFGLEPEILPPGSEQYWQDSGTGDGNTEASAESGIDLAQQRRGSKWRDLIPVIKLDISTGRLVFGNRLLPTTLSINFEEARVVYTTKPASSRLDDFTHMIKCKAENFKVILADSLKYTGPSDEPPRYMGEGFVVLQSNFVDLYYYQDEAGLVPQEPEMVELANGDIIQQFTNPCWGLDIKCGKGTDFSYGPWADRQREHLYRFFFPQDYQPLIVTKPPQVGEKRQFQSFDLRLSTLSDITMDILFSKDKETNAVHMNAGPGSYLEVTIPWVVTSDGFTSSINGQLLHLDASTSLQYRSLVESETLEFNIEIKYPRIWNGHQEWTCNFTGCKSTVHLIYTHKNFFQALLEDWSNKSVPDLYHFVPYTCHINLLIKEFELITVVNEHNWIDCSSQHQENAHLAVSGELFDMSFDLLFTEFLPPTNTLKFWIQGECLDLSLYLPEADSNSSISQLLAKCAKLTNRDGSIKQTEGEDSKRWRNVAQPSARWIDCWSVPILALSITYTYYPVPPLLKRQYDLDVTTPEREEILLSPIRPSGAHNKPNQKTPSTEDFDPTTLLPDIIEVELEVGPSVLSLTGSLLRHILFLKENYLGESQQFHDFDLVTGLEQEKPEVSTAEGDGETYKKEFDIRNYRPFEVTVSITLHDIQGHLMKNCTKDEPPCPSLYLERLGIEIHKTYRETKLQLLLSPLVLIAADNVERQESQQNLKEGHLAMAALQVRGHAMFSDVGRPLDSETLEYAWLVEVQVGDITGRLTLPQLYHIVVGVETFVLQFKHIDGDLQPPTPYHYCQHDLLQFQCPESTPSQPCLNPEDAKYRMTRLSVDAIEVCIVESGTALNLEFFPIRLATCNLHGGLTSSGLSALIQHICVRQYALISSLSAGSSSSSATSQSQTFHPDIWLEVGAVSLGPVFLDSIMSSSPEYMSCVQDTFLKIHDQKLKHLWFLWPPEEVVAPQSVEGKCGCVGGCAFFGKNRNGQIFFQPHKARITGSDSVFARFHILSNDDYGFGQSLLNKGEFIFDISDSSSGETSRNSPEPSDKCCMFFSGFRSQMTSKSHEGFSRRTAKETISKTRSQHEDLPEVSKNAWIPSSLDSKRGKRGNVISMQPHGGAGQCPSRRFVRQFSSPTRSSLMKTSSFLSHGSPLFLSVPGSNSNNDTSDVSISRKGSSHSENEKHSLEDRNKGENSNSNITPHKHNSRISLNGWPSVQSAADRKKRASSFTTRDRSPKVVKRAVSTDSAQSLDMFYSADEDSEASGTTDDTLAVDMPLVKKRHSTPSGNNGKLQKLEEKCSSFHGEESCTTREGSRTSSSSSTQHDSPDSHSVVSSSSFISAVSSQEDIALVNLHNQMDKPIVESPLLMSCYTAYMTQLKCLNWQEPPPLPHLTQQSGITEAGPNRHYLFLRSTTRWKPKFTPLVKGFTAIHMIDKNRSGRYARNHSVNQQHFGNKEDKGFFPGSLHSKFGRKPSKREENVGNEQEMHTTMVIKLSGDISIMVSPLQAETFKNFVDAIGPMLAGLHPLTVLNHLHTACSHHVEKLNQLKKEKVLYLGQLRAEAEKQAGNKLQKESKNPKISLAASPSGSLGGNNYEETKVERLHIFVQVSEVNMSIMQASIVEEIISFSALDNLKDLTCVSLLAVRLNNLLLQLYNSHTAQRKIQTFSDHTLESVLLPKPIDRSLKKARSVTLPVESLTLETSETQEVENIVLASIDSIHIQLRRLKNNSTILKDAVLTVIPSYMSKVSFTFERMTPTDEVEDDDEDSFDFGQSGEEEWVGFIMFECRLEDINVKCVKRAGFEPQEIENQQPNEKVSDEPGKSTKAGESSPSKDTRKSNPSSGSCDTRFSFPSCVSECGSSSSSSDGGKDLNLPELIGDASSFIVELKSVLFNFAAPPRMPNTRKIDFTRLDWHLLSTATPSINAWLKPCDRLFISLRKLDRQRKQRACAIMGCLMAEALEMQSIHMPVKSKYLVTKATPLAKTLQEDPSCQLVLVLKRYLNQVNLDEVEENLSPLHIPQLKALFHGLMALSRQWKNILYVPLLLEQNIRFRKSLRPMSVSFAFPPGERVNMSTQDDVEKTSLEECEISDETTNLLVAEGGSIPRGFSSKNGGKAESSKADTLQVFSSPESATDSSSSQHDAVDPQDGGTVTKSGKKRLPSYVPRSSRASVAFPLLGGPLDSPARYAGNAPTISRLGGFFMHPSHMKRNESHHSLKSATWSLSSMEPNFPTSTIDTPRRGMMEKEENFSDEDLYKWMARQQDYMRGGLSNYQYRYNDPNDQESKMNTLTSENSGDFDTSSVFPQVAFAPLGTQLADAHVIFQVLLDKLGVPIQTGSPSISKLVGPRASVSGGISLLKIDIVESEYQNNARHKSKSPFSHSSASHGKFFIDTSMDTPAFICDRFSVEIDVKDVRDFEQGEKGLEQDGKVAALVFTQEGLPNTTCVINFSINVNYVAQQINMPLLRLLHQFSTMYENIKETRSELHAIRPGSLKEKESPRGLQKKSTPSSDSQTETFHPHSPHGTSVSKPSTPTPTPTKSSAVGTSFSVGIKRPHSLSQRLRASTKGYTNLLELTVKDDRPSSPLSITPSESVAIDIPDSCSVPLSEPNLVTDIKDLQPRCWRTMFYLLDLYNTMPETKTVTDRASFPPAPDVSEGYKGNGKYEPLKEHKVDLDEVDHTVQKSKFETKAHTQTQQDHLKNLTKTFLAHEWIPRVVFGVVQVRKVRLLALLSGLKLEGELSGLHTSLTQKDKARASRKWSESSLTGQLGQTVLALLEGLPPNQQTVVKMSVGKSQALCSSQSKKGKNRNSALLTIGPVHINIPQHPVALHGMVTRSSRQLSTTLQELRSSRQSSRINRHTEDYGTGVISHSPQPQVDIYRSYRTAAPEHHLIHPIIIQFSIIVDSLTVGAALLPSLQAQYQMGQVISMGVTGSKAKFTIDLPQHTLSFSTKVPPSEANLPSSASIDLPPVHISAEYIQDSASSATTKMDSFTDGVVLRQGSYVSAMAEIGTFEHSLTTDLLNHLLLAQKVFMKEVNEVVQKMSGTDKPVPILIEEEKSPESQMRRLLFSLQLKLKGIQITATTPTSSAVRLETGTVELQLSNRVQNLSAGGTSGGGYMKLFGKAQVDLNLALGQLIKNALFEEAEPEFLQFAYFKTRICMRNALQDEMISSQAEEKEAVLITLNRPLIYIQPIALDKAVLVWLNYKNAYEYWTEQRASLNKEVLTATQQVFEKVPQISQLSTQSLGTLFLQLTVDDMGICVPLNTYSGSTSGTSKLYDTELKAAVVVTLESTRISACSCGSLVSKGRFSALCIRFAEDFETFLDEWKPDPNDTSIMNLCVVSEGTYEVCSRTIVPQGNSNAKWILNVQWQMEGVDIHVDTSIGKELSALFKTLTALTGEEETDEVDHDSMKGGQDSGHISSVQEPVVIRKGSILTEALPSFLLDPNMDAKKRSRLIEKEMNEQAKIINDLRLLGASQNTIQHEMRRLQELEAAVFNDFRRDWIKKLRKQSVKQASSIKDKLGLGTCTSGTPVQPLSLILPEEVGKKNVLNTLPSPTSLDSSPTHSHIRTASLDMSDLSVPEKAIVHKELSLDSVFSPSLSAEDELCTNTPTPSPTADNSPLPLPKSLSSPHTIRSLHAVPKIDGQSQVSKSPGDTKKTGYATPGATSSGVSSFKQPPVEPNIDFELDIQVFFNSGKCVLHTKDPSKEEEAVLRRSMQKERSISGGLLDISSPSHSKRRSGGRSNVYSSRQRYQNIPAVGQIADFTVLLIPGLDIKVHYNSKTVSGESPMGSTVSSLRPCAAIPVDSEQMEPAKMNYMSLDSGQCGTSYGSKKSGVKKASLFAWVTLQSIPEEAVLSPHVLDFLEQALEPIPIHMTKSTSAPTDSNSMVFSNLKSEAGGSTLVTPSQYAYASFPVDVIVYFHMQPSIIRFSCLPVSRVECLLRLPSVDLVFSSKRAEDEPNGVSSTEGTSGSKFKASHCRKETGSKNSLDSSMNQTAAGGLSMTGCLADFSLYIFHPYGGSKKSGSMAKEGEKSPLTTAERKDSLSLQVEFVKVNISRSRKLNVLSSEAALSKGSRSVDGSGAIIRFSAICDVGSASFKYDMRRLTEILAFPKAWYRRSIARRMFLGDQSSSALFSDQEDSLETSSSSGTLSPKGAKPDVCTFTGSSHQHVPGTQHSSISFPVGGKMETISEHSDNGLPTERPQATYQHNRDNLHLDLFDSQQSWNRATGSQIYVTTLPSSQEFRGLQPSSPTQYTSRQGNTWETLVLCALNLSRLNVHMNMGNVMGNTTWLTRDLKSQGRLSISSSGHKNFFITMTLVGSSLDAKGGIVGGNIELSEIDTTLHLKEDVKKEPDHTVTLKLGALELRLDYMGTSVLMGRVCTLETTLRDEWRVTSEKGDDAVMAKPTKRPALIFIHGNLGWDQLQLLISKSTTTDLVKMYTKLEEFFSQQFHSSKRVFSSLQPHYQRHSIRNPSRRLRQHPEGLPGDAETRHHRHWQKVLRMVSRLQLSTLPFALPRRGTILGGTVELSGNNISLACFHGINFRSKAWAIFSLKEPTVTFATEAQDVNNDDGTVATHIVQNLSFTLGHSGTESAHHASMATVCRISRNVLFPPQFRSMNEWFHYAFATSEIDDVGRFPVLEHDREGGERRSSFSLPSKSPEFNHNMEVIFALPSLQFHLKTEHLQGEHTPTLVDPKPVVECSFVTEFDDHIYVAVDAEAFFFLHDVITSYIKEKDSGYGKNQSPDSERKKKIAHPTEALQKDWRNYQCHTWHLEPTVRLLSWAGKQIEPYGVDYILHKLGFSHARVTIPKWLQRGCMDPLDKILSVVMEKMIGVLKEEREECGLSNMD